MYKLIVKTVENDIMLLSIVGSNKQYLHDYGINFACGKGYRSNEVEIKVSNFPVKFRKALIDRSIYVY